MRSFIFVMFGASALLLTVFMLSGFKAETQRPSRPFAIVVHGGAGGIKPGTVPPDREREYRRTLQEAIDKGYKILEQGGKATDAVEAAINVLEDSPLFNAGRGSVLTLDGKVEMDASFMDGKSGGAGAVCIVRRVKNPITLARAVMEKSPHVILVGAGAEAFARRVGVMLVDTSYFVTPETLEEWKRLRAASDSGGAAPGQAAPAGNPGSPGRPRKHGTVGCVALDAEGNLAAGTSTGGMASKWSGRVGDSPIIGAGTYAENGVVGVSCTGHGEFFIRNAVAYDVAARIKYAHANVQDAVAEILHKKLLSIGGYGGIIALDSNGNPALDFNTEGMFRAFRHSDGRTQISLFRD